MHVSADDQPLMRIIGLDAEAVFSHPQIVPWRRLDDRDNCTLDADIPDRGKIRLHVKRYYPRGPGVTAAQKELEGFRLLESAQISTAPLVAWGRLSDRRSFIIMEDLAGYRAADKMIAAGTPFERLMPATADLTARLHDAGLHHRDLYLCHFFAKAAEQVDVKLIDVARVRKLPRFLRERWVIKDLAQFWYSTLSLPITDAQREAWLVVYARRRGLSETSSLRRSIEKKVRTIARHDRRLRSAQPSRNVSIPHPG